MQHSAAGSSIMQGGEKESTDAATVGRKLEGSGKYISVHGSSTMLAASAGGEKKNTDAATVGRKLEKIEKPIRVGGCSIMLPQGTDN